MPLGLATRLPPGVGAWLAGAAHARMRGVNGERRPSGVPGQRPPFGSHRSHPGDGSVRRPDGVPAPVVVLAWVHIVLGAAGLAIGGLFCLQLWLVPDWLADFALAFAVPIVLILSTVWFVPGLVGGIGLLRGKSWAHILIFLLSILMVFIFPLGTVLGGFGFVALVADKSPSGTK